MKLTIGILITAMMVGGAVAQNPDAIDNARNTVKSLQQQQAAKPAPGAVAPAVKPAVIAGAKTAAPTAKPVPPLSQTNKLQHVNVVPGAKHMQIEIRSKEGSTPHAS